ncbi:FkbM family methyltransferase [Bradyrhizobium sp. BRP22]|uniref:FkbM family methyltransferase n=1 Tax=Bradyrhizobium sp. BRP22 TaxID=2793821 RepID=UPI001CD5DF3D|nr:FkbM family methyltransferase [Bradyrhizobium sp. BRP22]MCA1458742.1 FkbM family methyltransferase [Bradyrhizobium sp. BRP22]
MRRIPRPLQSMKLLLAWMMPPGTSFQTYAIDSKLRFIVQCRDVIGRHIAKYGRFEPELTEWIGGYLQSRPKGIVVDVGANLGWHAVHAAQHDSVTSVVAFEPDATNAWLLDRNLTINDIDKVVVYPCAVGASVGRAHLHRYKRSNNGRHSLIKNYGLGSRVVPLTDVDSALEALGLAQDRVLLMKIDVEGFEPAVLAGAVKTLDRADVVITEYTPQLSRAGGLSVEEMTDRLLSAGFVPHQLAGKSSRESSKESSKAVRVELEELRRIEDQTDILWIKPAMNDAIASSEQAAQSAS